MKRKCINNLLLYFVFFLCITPAFLLNNEYISYFVEYGLVVCFACIAIMYLFHVIKRSNSKFIYLVILFWVVFIISTIINGNGNVFAPIKQSLKCLSLCFLYDMGNEKSKLHFLKSLYRYLYFIIVINFISVLLFPNGLYFIQYNSNKHFFLGHRNNSIEYIIPALFIEMLIKNKKITLLYIICLLTTIITWSVNAIVVLVFMLFYSCFLSNGVTKKIINEFNLLIAFLSIDIGIVVFRLQYLFKHIIVDVFHKTLDFTGRTKIWDKSISWIKKSPIIGYGYEDPLYKLRKIGHSNSCHNYLLDYLYIGGIIELLIMIIIIVKVLLKSCKTELLYRSIFINVIFSYFILWLATPLHIDTICINMLVFLIIYLWNFTKEDIYEGIIKKNID